MNLKKRIAEIAFKNKLSHLGSYFSSVNIIDEIFSKMDNDDIFILSAGHAALALYVCIEKYHKKNAELLFKSYGSHPHRCEEDKIYCSTGSLGLGITIALGRAIAAPKRRVWVLLSDGEAAEGSVWESLKTIVEENIQNLEIFININGYCAYKEVDKNYLVKRLKAFLPTINIRYSTVEHYSFLKGLNAHYHIMNEENYQEVLNS